MKFSTLWKLGAVVALLTVTVKVDRAWSAVNCYDLLVGQKYRCKYKYEPGVEYPGTCASFTIRDLTKEKMYLNWAGIYYTCTCTAKGSYAIPQFNQGKDFLCSSINPSYHDAFTGKVLVNGNKIKGLYNSDSNDASAIVECTKEPSCP